MYSVLRYKSQIWIHNHPDTRLRAQGCEGPWLFFDAKRGPRTNLFGKHRSIPCVPRKQMLDQGRGGQYNG